MSTLHTPTLGQTQNPQAAIHPAYHPHSTTAVDHQTPSTTTDFPNLILRENQALRKQIALLESLAKQGQNAPASPSDSQSSTPKRRISKLPLIRLPARATDAHLREGEPHSAVSHGHSQGLVDPTELELRPLLPLSMEDQISIVHSSRRPSFKRSARSDDAFISARSSPSISIKRTIRKSASTTFSQHHPIAGMPIDLPSIMESVSQIGLAGPGTGPSPHFSQRLPHTPEPPPFDIPRQKSLPQTPLLIGYDPKVKNEGDGLQTLPIRSGEALAVPYPERLPYGTTIRTSHRQISEQAQHDAQPDLPAPEEPLKELFTVAPLDRTSLRLQEPYSRIKQYPMRRVDMGPIHRAAAITQSRIRLPSLIDQSMLRAHAPTTKAGRATGPYPRFDSYLPLTLAPLQARRSQSASDPPPILTTFSQIGMTGGKPHPPRGYRRAPSRRGMQVVREDDTESEHSTTPTSDYSAEMNAQTESRYLKALSQRRAGRNAQRGPRGPR